MNTLEKLGWNEKLNEQTKLQEEQFIGRVIVQQRGQYKILSEAGEFAAKITGKFFHQIVRQEEYPAVGDWVVYTKGEQDSEASIHQVLPRKSKFSRKTVGGITEEQIVATNIDTIFIVTSLNDDLNLRRIERYILLAWESGANPVIILNKLDLCTDIEEKKRLVEEVAIGVPIIEISALKNQRIENLSTYVKDGQTVALVGSSGVGKSTLINQLIGRDVQDVGGIREDDSRGRHTTTHRELFVIPSGGIIIDTPGMREIQLTDSEDGLSSTFHDIEELAELCRYRDCTHENEPKCAVKNAIDEGTLSADRLQSYRKLQREIHYIARKENQRLQLLEKEKWKKITKSNRK
ncbi:ribosome small subunit-dependent GTPase A [Lottiidibacillus patelloidae]|uniref:Small ribosomal subunit biogenesis GTPase RsgA n=1 Tax=Lottiidibacillus patelloidae TaxID=2670334 RepID=A0A263BXP6_9BACI|nr:ribosome small subunit-dependent GTPase A [Lottiidibacillus patelloidae]OZM58440.1 ribosome small subunit-dependent GTPase A [Lottiidibacillus patelloidae]